MTENEYTQKAQESYIDFLKRSTRFDINNIKINDARTYTTLSQLSTHVSMSVGAENTTVSGIASSERGDVVSQNNESQHSNNVSEIIRMELNRTESIDECVNYFTNIPFGSVRFEQSVRIHPTRLLHVYTCKTCNGNGELVCTKCKGRGKLDCTRCNHTGRLDCDNCNGKGSFQDYSGKHINCGKCHATGSYECHVCKGRGEITCSDCGGRGRVSCSTCNGTGKMTTISHVHTYAQPKYSASYPSGSLAYLNEIVENKIGLNNIANFAQLAFKNDAKNYDKRCFDLHYDARLMVCEMDIEIDEIKTTVIIFGNDYTLFDSGGVLGELLKEDLEVIEKLTSDKALFSFRFKQNIRTGVTNFMESEINQEMVDNLNKSLESTAVSENLGRALSTEYIEKSTDHLKVILKKLAKKVAIEITFIIFIIALIRTSAFLVTGNYNFILSFPFVFEIATLSVGLVLYNLWVRKMGKARLMTFARKYTMKTAWITLVISTVMTFGMYEGIHKVYYGSDLFPKNISSEESSTPRNSGFRSQGTEYPFVVTTDTQPSSCVNEFEFEKSTNPEDFNSLNLNDANSYRIYRVESKGNHRVLNITSDFVVNEISNGSETTLMPYFSSSEACQEFLDAVNNKESLEKWSGFDGAKTATF
jgi:hypothetical protein